MAGRVHASESGVSDSYWHILKENPPAISLGVEGTKLLEPCPPRATRIQEGIFSPGSRAIAHVENVSYTNPNSPLFPPTRQLISISIPIH